MTNPHLDNNYWYSHSLWIKMCSECFCRSFNPFVLFYTENVSFDSFRTVCHQIDAKSCESFVLKRYLSLPSGYHKRQPHTLCFGSTFRYECVCRLFQWENVSPVPIIDEPANLCYVGRGIFFLCNAVSPTSNRIPGFGV